MILADTSIWVDHMRQADEMLQTLLGRDEVLIHPFVLGELALGNLHDRGKTLRYLSRLPQSVVARNSEVFALIEGGTLFGSGIGLVDAHLLASARLTKDASLWTRDRRLEAQARGLSVAVNVLR